MADHTSLITTLAKADSWMTPHRWDQIQDIYYSSLALDDHEREKFLSAACAADQRLRDELDSLMRAERRQSDFLNRPVVEIGLKILIDSELKTEETRQSDESHDPLIGITVDGRYEVIEKLGSGGIGDVYSAHDLKVLSRTVVLKVLKDASLSRRWIVTKFEQEIEALTKISDPGIVGILDAGTLPDHRRYLVMEFVEGCNLRDFIAQNRSVSGQLDLEDVGEIMRQVSRSVSAAHDAGVIHRDLKPANIMVHRNSSGDLLAKVIDFGVAKLTNPIDGHSTSAGIITGTVAYMSPEQLQGQKVRPPSDVYALGVIAYEMITGNKPFNPESHAMLLPLQQEGVKVPPGLLRPALPRAAQDVILKALSYHQADRYQRARDFGEALADALEEPSQVSSESGKEFAATILTEEAQVSAPAVTARDSAVVSRRGSFFRRVAVLSILPVIALLLAVGAWYVLAPERVSRAINYSLLVQRVRDGKPHGEPFASSGKNIFETGDAFKLNVSSQESGYLYVVNEGGADGPGTIFTLLFPTPGLNNGSSQIEKPSFQTNWNQFAGKVGREELWMIWASSPVPQLEAAKKDAMLNNGEVRDVKVSMLMRDFLKNHVGDKVESSVDKLKEETVVRISGDLLVNLLVLEHK